MERINAVTFAPFCARGTFEKEETRQSLKLMKEKTGANYVIFAPNGMQKTAFSEEIDYRTDPVSYTHLDVYKRQFQRNQGAYR